MLLTAEPFFQPQVPPFGRNFVLYHCMLGICDLRILVLFLLFETKCFVGQTHYIAEVGLDLLTLDNNSMAALPENGN